MTVFPCGSAIPEASNLNFAAGQTIANAVVARVGSNGQVCVYVSGSAGLLVDVNGFVPAGSNLTGADSGAVVRLPEQRRGTDAEQRHRGAGRRPGWRPDSQARTAMLNVTAVAGVIGRIHDRVPVRNPGADRVEPELRGRTDDRQRGRGEDRRRRPSVRLHVVGRPPVGRRQRHRTVTRRSAHLPGFRGHDGTRTRDLFRVMEAL